MIDLIKDFFTFRKKRQEDRNFALGLNSFISFEDDLHIVVLDYDIHDLPFILADINDLVKLFNLSGYEIYRTQNGHHAFFWWDHIPYSRLQMIIAYSRCDRMFKYLSTRYTYKTIRVCGKYEELDIRFVKAFPGKRQPSPNEKTLGDLKKKEYLSLMHLHPIFAKHKKQKNNVKEKKV